MIVSIVVPTYNRTGKLEQTLDHLLRSDSHGLDKVEIIVVDDGSPVPVEPIVAARPGDSPFSVCCISQANSGAAAARNTGFRASCGEIVLCIDDDIICPPDLILAHVQAHQERPGSVVCGYSLYAKPSVATPLSRYLDRQSGLEVASSGQRFIQADLPASGQISFESCMFDRDAGLYANDLPYPDMEEFELGLRLGRQNIPILFAPHLVAAHLHDVSLDYLAHQKYKYGLGYAATSIVCPETLAIPRIANVIKANKPLSAKDPKLVQLKKLLKFFLARKPLRRLILHSLKTLERKVVAMPPPLWLYEFTLGLYFVAGVQDGLRRSCGTK